MTALQSGAGALRRSRDMGLRVLLAFASMLLLEGCRTWDDTGGWHGRRSYHHHQHRRQPPHHPSPAPLVVPKFQPPARPPPLPAQPVYRPPPSGHQWHHQRSGEPSRRPGHDGKRHEHKWQGGNGGQDHRKRR